MKDSRFSVPGVLAASLGHFGIDFYMNFLPALLPIVAIRLNLEIALCGLAVSITSVVSSFSQPIFGYFADRWGKGWLLVVSVAWAALFTSMLGFATSFALLVIFPVLGGLGSGVYHPIGAASVSRVSEKSRGLAMALYSAGGSLGFALAPVLIVPLVVSRGLNSLVFLALPGLAVAGILVLTGLHRLNLGLESNVTSPATLQQVLEVVGDIPRPLRLLTLVACLRSWFAYMVAVFAPLYLVKQELLPEVGVGGFLTLYLISGTAGALAGGYLSDRYGRKRLIAAACIVGFAVFTVFFWEQTASFIWILVALGGFTLQAALPASVVLAQELYPKRSAMASGIIEGVAFGLAGLGISISGLLAEMIGLGPALKLHLPLLLLAAVVVQYVPVSSSPHLPVHRDRLSGDPLIPMP